MRRSSWKGFLCAALLLMGARGVFVVEAVARARARDVVRLPGGSLAVAARIVSTPRGYGHAGTVLSLTVDDRGALPLAVARTDFALSAEGDMFGVKVWDQPAARTSIAPGRSRQIRLTFDAPAGAAREGTLVYRTSPAQAPTTIALGAPRAASRTSSWAVNTVYLNGGVGEPWGTTVDGSGNVWFAEPGCDFAPTCSSSTAPGQIGKIAAGSHALSFYQLPDLVGNQPIFLAFDSAGKLWFTTPDNDHIGEFDPATGTFVGQWPVTPGSGPWDLTFANGKVWYTEHLASAIGSFDPSSHVHQDFQTPSGNSWPYGIAALGTSIWFTENNSNVDRVAVLNTKNNNVSEYPIVQPTSGTPHLIAIDAGGHPWWTEGWSGTIGTLDPAVATSGQCGTTSGVCRGVERFALPVSTTCSTATHVSGMAYEPSNGLVWLDDSLTSQVGSFDPSTSAFALSTISNCPHTHDGLALDGAGDVWFDEEFSNAMGELIP